MSKNRETLTSFRTWPSVINLPLIVLARSWPISRLFLEGQQSNMPSFLLAKKKKIEERASTITNQLCRTVAIKSKEYVFFSCVKDTGPTNSHIFHYKTLFYYYKKCRDQMSVLQDYL